MKSTVVTIIVILVLLVGLGAGGWFLFNKFRASADVENAPVNMDFNNDGKIDSLDLNMLLTAVSNKSANPKYDLNKDNKVDSLDIDLFNKSWEANQPATGTL